MTLNKTWRLCLSMWRWMAEERKRDNYLSVDTLKAKWLQKHGFKKDSIYNDCFFCEYAAIHKARIRNTVGCSDCPGTKIDRSFSCSTDGCDYHNVIAFYNNLRALNRKRIKK